MNHQEIERDGIVERYVRHQLSADERLAFQEHFFACDQCFAEVQTTASFVAGVQDASRRGLLDTPRAATAAPFWNNWFRPAFAFSLAACAFLIAAFVWLALWKVPAYQTEIARERQAREESERKLLEARTQAAETQRQLEAERARISNQAPPSTTPERPGPEVIAQANIPTVTLEATRSSGSGSLLTIPANAKHAVLRIPVEPGNRVSNYRVLVQARDGRAVAIVDKLKPNRASAISVSLLSKDLPPAQYIVRVYGAVGTQTELLGEYDLRVAKQ